MDLSSGEESEYESGDEEDKERLLRRTSLCCLSVSPPPTPPTRRPLLASFQDRSADGPGQPSLQETPETKTGLKEKEAPDQGSALRS